MPGRKSGIGLSAGFYSDEQAAAIAREVFGVDSALVADGTYFAIEAGDVIIACGFGFAPLARIELPLSGGVTVALTRMRKEIGKRGWY